MDPRPHAPILPQNSFIWIELSGPTSIQAMNPLIFELHNMLILPF